MACFFRASFYIRRALEKSPHDGILGGRIGLNRMQRRTANLALNTLIPVYPFPEKVGNITMVAINLMADLMVKGKGKPKQVFRCLCVGRQSVLVVEVVELSLLLVVAVLVSAGMEEVLGLV